MPETKFKPLALQWSQLALDSIKITRSSPPAAARALAMVHTAMFDAWSVFNNTALSTSTASYIKAKQEDCTKNNSRKAFSYAAYRVLRELFRLELPPEHKNMFSDMMCDCGYDPNDNTMEINTPQGIGNLAAKMTIEYRIGDGSNHNSMLHFPSWSDYTDYKPVNTPFEVKDINRWQPLMENGSRDADSVQKFLLPHWGLVRAYALNENLQYRPGKPYNEDQPEFIQQAKDIIDISSGLTDEHKSAVEYWADGPGTYTPPGHWCEIAAYMALKKKYMNSHCIKLFFAVTNALLDASIACWECKHYYDSVRPITAIRELFRHQNINSWDPKHTGRLTIKGENWNPYLQTPPFPEYVSGHSTFSKAAAVVLKQFIGSDEYIRCIKVKKGSSKIEPGKTPRNDLLLEWSTFSEAADQAGLSRLYGGIHFSKGNEEGRKLGMAIGMNAWKRSLYYFNEPDKQM